MTTRDRAITPKRNEGSSILPAPLGERTYDAQNWVGGEGGRGDMVMLIRPNGQPAESVRYSAFGRPFNIRSNKGRGGGADFNGDGVVELLDLLEFNSRWSAQLGLSHGGMSQNANNPSAGSRSADVDASGVIDLLDLLTFNSTWNAELGRTLPVSESPSDAAGGGGGTWISRRYLTLDFLGGSNPSTAALGPDNPIGYCGYVFNPETLE